MSKTTEKTPKQCHNPWKPECTSEDIKLYIQINKENLPICHSCWNNIADSNHEWESKPQQLTVI